MSVNTQVGDIERLPFAKPNTNNHNILDLLSNSNIEITKSLINTSFVEDEYKKSPISFFSGLALERRVKLYLSYENHLITQVLSMKRLLMRKFLRFMI